MKSWGLPLWDLLTGRKAKRPEPAGSADAPKSPLVAVPDRVAEVPRASVPSRAAAVGTRPKRPAAPTASPTPLDAQPAAARASKPARAPSMADRYEGVVRLMLSTHGVKVRKWRTAMSGVAWELKYADGSIRRLIESPRPRGPMSAAIFLHEIGHHAIGFNRYRPRCLEEYHAWKFAVDQMEAHGLNVTKAVRRRIHVSLHYAIGKAVRRGLAVLPAELGPFVAEPPKSGRRKRRAHGR